MNANPAHQRLRFLGWVLAYLVLAAACLWSLARSDELALGRNPWANLQKTAAEFATPSFLDVWIGNPKLEYKSDDGTILRTEDRRDVEKKFLVALAEATWTTIKIGTLGSLLAAVAALPFGLARARNLKAPKAVRWAAKLTLDISRSIHTLVFGLILVGTMGLGPTAGIFAIAAHSLGTYGKLYAETLESLDMAAIDAVRAVGASPVQAFFTAAWPSALPQLISNHLYIWEFNIRDSTILGLVGAGGIGLLISEAVSLFQWGRLATILLVVVVLVTVFDSISSRARERMS